MEPFFLRGQMAFWAYILRNAKGRFYIGQTEDLPERLKSHNRTDAVLGRYTRKHGPWALVWSEEHPTRASAMARERQIKQMKSARWIRENLLNGRVPTRRDLPIACRFESYLWSHFLSRFLEMARNRNFEFLAAHFAALHFVPYAPIHEHHRCLLSLVN